LTDAISADTDVMNMMDAANAESARRRSI